MILFTLIPPVAVNSYVKYLGFLCSMSSGLLSSFVLTIRCHSALEAQSKLGGEDLIPFYGLMEGGREGELFAELEDYFYYAQLRQ